ncbi:LIM domain-binding protein 2 [Hydra vulgaris]|uniref:LIM domain-binding protein 2 n=1 Tax=Hydra vulgaris TaxID=6087 RepID=UPI001F5EA117|nr:LIM domain-binding protein 2 [Hydra vulgaris]XP_047124106.1 LIM domain-binding protein 2 [Hydra vulgaris]XP_047124107.1 LIM domain-binding protein 2 [Hydra vulgaris]XP_047124108.1 LIM domain-binding protein 2 [Hydra vulgaris]
MQRSNVLPSPSNRRSLPYYLQPDYKIHEFNKRLQHGAMKVEQLWWDELINEFFEDMSTLTVHFKEKSHVRKYTIHRRLIPRFFRSLFDGGVAKIFFMVLETKENLLNSSVTLECKQSSMIVSYSKPNATKVHVDGNLSIEFSFDEYMRIRSWKFIVKEVLEMVPKSHVLNCAAEKAKLEEITKKITEFGFSPGAVQHLRIGVVLESMQKLMSRQKTFGLSPRDALKSVVYENWQSHLLNQDYEQRTRLWSGVPYDPVRAASVTNKRRKPRKPPSADAKTSKSKKLLSSNAIPPHPNPEILLVDEPILMGKFDDDERIITRLENPTFMNVKSGSSNNIHVFQSSKHRSHEDCLE